ncbi:hypothetical protein ZEAMMB73_Zm00001d034171 [Zea mays]|uniref:Uncharacterized protein n=1 Tax=Zea mays TaxID=4577 RepID=A0A1D6L614_MAIZE|nr:hypothetical protein ZEAMMB73_Zm00001d034171 [Zea mays]
MLLPWLLFQQMGLPQLVTLHFKIRGLILQDGNSPLLLHLATRLHLRLSVNWVVDSTSSFWTAFMMTGPTGRGNSNRCMVQQCLIHS